VSRLVEVTWHLELDSGQLEQDGDAFWLPLLALGPQANALVGDPEQPAPRDIRHLLSLDLENPNSLLSSVRAARASAQRVRESISTEMWEQINGLYLSLLTPHLAQDVYDDPSAFYRAVRAGAQFFQGLADSTMAHDEAWHFVQLGTYLERADNAARLLELQSHLLTIDATITSDTAVRWLAVLRSCGAAEAYARYYSLRVEPARVLEFVLLNPLFPQTIRFSLSSARAALVEVAGGPGIAATSAAVRAMGRVCARLENSAIDEVLDEGLPHFLHDVRGRIAEVADLITRTYLRDEAPPSRLVGVARAAMIMAAQQQ
jgi:uncharacterized alpha-E superfamily protein